MITIITGIPGKPGSGKNAHLVVFDDKVWQNLFGVVAQLEISASILFSGRKDQIAYWQRVCSLTTNEKEIDVMCILEGMSLR